MAEDFEILTSVTKYNNGKLTLEDYQENLFLSCYKNAVFYYNNVTRTKSFQNEQVFREFIEVYLIFVAIQNYITERMKDQFNVSTFNKYQCKNYFISNGVDYFDELPLFFQRRLIELLNDLQRNKGTDNIFPLIKSVLNTNNLNIYRYTLVKTNDNDLKFYKVPYNEEISPNENEIYSFEEITGNDPYWRSSKNEILQSTFNTLESKYITIEYVYDLLKNGYELSYFNYMLNDLEIYDKNMDKKSSLTFLDTTISQDKIKLYDAMIALYSLYLQYVKNDIKFGDNLDTDYINRNNSINRIYGYCEDYVNNEEVNELINNKILPKIDTIINNNINEDKTFYINLRKFITNFNLTGFKFSDNSSFSNIEKMYYNNISDSDENINMKDEFLSLATFIKVKNIYNYNDSDTLYNLVKRDKLEEALITLTRLFLNNKLNLSYISIYPNLMKLFKNYISYCIINDKLNSFGLENPDNSIYNEEYDLFYNFLIQNEVIINELIDYVNMQYGYYNDYLENFLNKMNTSEGPAAFTNMFYALKSFYLNPYINRYRNLKTFFELFTSFEDELYKNNNSANLNNRNEFSKINISDFNSSYRFNEDMRKKLENYIYEVNDRDLYNYLKKLWELKFISNYDLQLIKSYDQFKNYLLVNNEDLFIYVTNHVTEDIRTEIEEKILNISNSIETYIGSSDKIIYNSTLNIIFSKFKNFAEIMVKVFKAYTLDTINSRNILDVNDKFSNHVKIFDEVDFSDCNLQFTLPEYLDVTDDIYELNGEIDYKQLLLVQNVVYYIDEEGNLISSTDDNEFPNKFTSIEVYIYEENSDLINGFEKDTNYSYFTDFMHNNKLLPYDNKQPTLKLNGNRYGLVELNKNKSYIYFVKYNFSQLIDFTLENNGLGILENRLNIIGENSTDPFIDSTTNIEELVKNKYDSLTTDEEKLDFINKNYTIIKINNDGYITFSIFNNSEENNGFIEVGYLFNNNFFKTFFEYNRRYEKDEENMKKVFHRMYLNDTFMEKYNNPNKIDYIKEIGINNEKSIILNIPSDVINLNGKDYTVFNSYSYLSFIFSQPFNITKDNPLNTKDFIYNFEDFPEHLEGEIRNNSKLLSFVSVINKPTPHIETISLIFDDDTLLNSDFKYIDVENKGITSSNYTPYLDKFNEYAVELGLSSNINESINLINEVPNNIYNTVPNSKFINYYNNDNITIKANNVYNSNKQYTILINENNEEIYNFNECRLNNTVENVLESGKVNNSLIASKIFGFKVFLSDGTNTYEFENFDKNGDMTNIFNKITVDSTKTYTMTVYSYTTQSSLYNGNLIYKLSIDTDRTKGFNFINESEDFIVNIDENTSIDNNVRYIKKNTFEFTLTDEDIERNIYFKLKGILTFETFVDYEEDSKIIYKPHSNSNYSSIIMWNDTNTIEPNYKSEIVLHEFTNSNRRIKTCIGWENTIRNNWLYNTTELLNEFNIFLNRKVNNTTINDNEKSFNVFSIDNDEFKYKNLADENNKLTFGNCFIEDITKEYFDLRGYFDCNDVINVIIPSNIITIRNYALKSSRINTFTFGPNVMLIYDESFRSSYLDSMYFLNDKLSFNNYLEMRTNSFSNLEYMKKNHFRITLPRNLTKIYSSAFNSSTINSIDFSKCHYLYEISDSAFGSCYYLGRRYVVDATTNEEVKIDNSCIYEGESNDYTSYWNSTIKDGYKLVDYNDNLYIKFNSGLNNSYLAINRSCFENCQYLRRIDLGNTHMIASYAFNNCVRLNYVNAPQLRYLGVRNSISFAFRDIYYKLLTYIDENGNKYYSNSLYEYITINNTDYEIKNKDNHYYIMLDGNEVTLNEEELNFYHNNSMEASWFGDVNSHGYVFRNCYSLLEVKTSNLLKTIHNNIFDNVGTYFIYENDNSETRLGCLYNDNGKLNFSDFSSVNKDSNGLYVINDYYRADNEYASPYRIINENSYTLDNNKIIDYFKFNYEGTEEEFSNVIKKKNWNSIFTIDKSYNMIGHDYENNKYQWLFGDKSTKINVTNMVTKYDRYIEFSYPYNKYNYSTLNNANVFDIDFSVDKFYLDENHTIETNELSFTSFADILNNNKTDNEFYTALLNNVNNFNSIENKFEFYENDGIDSDRPRKYKEDEKIDRFLKSISLIHGNNNTPDDNDSEDNKNKEYYFSIKAKSIKKINSDFDNNEYNTVIFIDSEKIRKENHYVDNSSGYYVTDTEIKMINYDDLQEALNNTHYTNIVTDYMTKNVKTKHINKNDNPKTYNKISNMSYIDNIINKNTSDNIIDPWDLNVCGVISHLQGERAYNADATFVPFKKHDISVINLFTNEINEYNPDFDPEYIKRNEYNEKLIMFNDNTDEFENSYEYTNNYCYSKYINQQASIVVNIKTTDSNKNHSLNCISKIYGITMNDDNTQVKSYRIGLYINNTKYDTPFYEFEVSNESSTDIIENSIISLKDIYDSLNNSTEIDSTTNTVTIHWNGGISKFNF